MGPGGLYPRKTLFETLGIPEHMGGIVTKPDPLVVDPRSLRLERDPMRFVGSVGPISPIGVNIAGKPTGVASSSGRACCLPAVKHGKAKCFRVFLETWVSGGQYPRKIFVIEKLRLPDYRGGKVTKPVGSPGDLLLRPKTGTRSNGVCRFCWPLFIPWCLNFGKIPVFETQGKGSQAVEPACLQAVKPRGRARPKTGTRLCGCCRVSLGHGARERGWRGQCDSLLHVLPGVTVLQVIFTGECEAKLSLCSPL